MVHGVLASELGRRIPASARLLTEVPFGYATQGEGEGGEEPATTLLDGAIDLAFREGPAWVLVDFKTDAAARLAPEGLVARYRGQLRPYVALWRDVLGEPVAKAVLLFTEAMDAGGAAGRTRLAMASLWSRGRPPGVRERDVPPGGSAAGRAAGWVEAAGVAQRIG